MFHLKPYLNTSAPAHLCNLLTSVTRRENKQCALNSNCPELRKYVVSRDHTHVFGVELIHLLLNFALTFRVDGQEVAGEGQRAAAGFVAREQEDKRLAHDLILSYHLFGPPGGGLLWGKPVDQIRGRRFRLRIAGGISRVSVPETRTPCWFERPTSAEGSPDAAACNNKTWQKKDGKIEVELYSC